jgi:hypothetical protein
MLVDRVNEISKIFAQVQMKRNIALKQGCKTW